MELTIREIDEIFGMRKENIRRELRDFCDDTYTITTKKFVDKLHKLSNTMNDMVKSMDEVYELYSKQRTGDNK